MPNIALPPPCVEEVPLQRLEPSAEQGPHIRHHEIAAEEYAEECRRMYEAQPQMSLLGLIRLMWGVLTTGTAPRTYKL